MRIEGGIKLVQALDLLIKATNQSNFMPITLVQLTAIQHVSYIFLRNYLCKCNSHFSYQLLIQGFKAIPGKLQFGFTFL